MKTCEYCDKEFVGTGIRFCSRFCANKGKDKTNNNKKVLKICNQCRISYKGTFVSKFCSKKCRNKYYYNEVKDTEEFKEKIKIKTAKNSEKNKLRVKKWCLENPDKVKEREKRRLKNPNYRLSKIIRNGINGSIKKIKNGNSWEKILGYTLNDLIKHFKDNHNFDIKDLNENIHIDHIIPINIYKFSSFEDDDFKKCWNIRNLRPLAKEENLQKWNKLDMKLVEEYNILDLLPSSAKTK